MGRGWKYIALVVPRGVPSFEQLARGVIQYGVDHDRRWIYLNSPDVRTQPVVDFKGWHGDGMITSIVTHEDAVAAGQLQMPAIDTSAWLEQSPVPRVIHDNRRLGEQAAEHFLERGFRRLAYYGVDGFHSTNQRLAGFKQTIAEHGCQFNGLLSSPQKLSGAGTWSAQHRELEQWIMGLTKPVGIFATNDCLGSMILNICLEHGLTVPDQVAVLGVGDDHMVCKYSRPPLSSIAPTSYRIGYQAARCLDRRMAGEALDEWEMLIPPRGVVARESTRTIAVEDARLIKVLTFMREHAHEGINVEIACRGMNLSRRRIEGLFREQLGCSPHDYLLGQRLRLAAEQLAMSNRRSFDDVARTSGFMTGKQMLAVFKRELGITPGEYRRLALSPARLPPELPVYIHRANPLKSSYAD